MQSSTKKNFYSLNVNAYRYTLQTPKMENSICEVQPQKVAESCTLLQNAY